MEALRQLLELLVSKSFAGKGGQYIDASGGAVDVEFPLGAGGVESMTAGIFVPDTDGTFGAVSGNIKGLSGSVFKAGISKYFIASKMNIATGTGTIYYS